MRTVIVNNILSLDGFIASADGNPLVSHDPTHSRSG